MSEDNLIKIIDADLEKNEIRINNHVINYITAGTGKPLILLHGVNIGWGHWHPNIAALSKYFKVFALDLPGAGKSSKIDFKDCALQKDFVDVVEQFILRNGLEGSSLIGHSLGGWIAMHLALRPKLRISKLLLVSPVGLTDYMPWSYRPLSFRSVAKLLSLTVMKPTKANVRKFLISVLHNKTAVNEEFVEYYYDCIKDDGRLHPFLLMNRLAGFFHMNKELNMGNLLRKINQPTLVVAGEKDPIIPPAKMVSAIKLMPNARLQIFPASGHTPNIEKINEFNESSIAFLLE